MRMSNDRLNALYILDNEFQSLIYGSEERNELERLAHVYAPAQTCDSILKNRALLADADVIFSGWRAPLMDDEFLNAAPKLRAVFYGAGSISYITTDAFWEREIVISSAYAANAIPVAEYALGVILLSLKNFWRFSALAKAGCGWGSPARYCTGAFRATVALIGCGMVARKLIGLLKSYDLRCIVYDPFLSEQEARGLGVERCSLNDAFAKGDVVSLHAPDKPQTRGMIAGEHFMQMKQGGTFINTARGLTVRQDEMIAVLDCRRDLTAILDVAYPEPPVAGSALYSLPNVVLTPHIAGSVGPECERLGRYMVDEFKRYLNGEPLEWQITREVAEKLA